MRGEKKEKRKRSHFTSNWHQILLGFCQSLELKGTDSGQENQ